MTVSDDELALLSTIAYLEKSDVLDDLDYNKFWNGAYENQDYTLGEIFDEIADDEHLERLRSPAFCNKKDDLHMTGAEWANVLEEARTNPDIRNFKYADVDSYTINGYRAFCFTSDDEAYVVFRGTGADLVNKTSEWPDNANGLYQSDILYQKAGLNYVNYCHARFGKDITTCGQSNGSNKAMYAAIKSLWVTRCVGFDGQGFGSAFLAQNKDAIAQRKHLITAYNVDADFVSPLLFSIAGQVNYVCGNRIGDDYFTNPNSPQL